MHRQSRKRLEEALREFGSPDHSPFPGAGAAGELGSYLEIAASLQADARTLPGPPSGNRGREVLLSTLASQEGNIGGVGKVIHSQPLIMKVGGAAAGVVLVFTGMAGASAAMGGPNVADPVFDAAGIRNSDDDALENTDDAKDAADDVAEMDDVDMEADDVSDEDADGADDIADENADDNDVDDESDNSDDEDAIESTDDAGDATGDDSDDADDSSHDDETTDDHTPDNVTGEEEEHN